MATPELTHDEILRYYRARVPKLKGNSAGLRGACPVHGGEHDSFTVDPQTGLACCHSQCGERGWNPFTLEQDLHGGSYQEAATRVFEMVGRTSAVQPKIVAIYNYTDENGDTLFEVCRYEPGEDGKPKDFKQRRPKQGGGWIWSTRGIRKVPYRLPAVLAADRVLIVEGEKDVHTLERFGYCATCNAGGAGKWRPESNAYFHGKDVIILADNDEPGRRHAERVEKSLTEVAKSVRVLDLPGLRDKGDVTDWVAAGGTSEQFEELLNQLEEEPTEPEPAFNPPSLDQFRSDKQGIHVLNGDGFKWIGSPLTVEAVTRDSDDRNSGKLVRFKNRYGKDRREVVLDTKLVAEGIDALEPLVSQSYYLNPTRRAKESLKAYVYQSHSDRQIRTVSEIGWNQEAYVFPEKTVELASKEEILFWHESQMKHRYRQAGTLEQWRQEVARYCAGNSRLVFAIAAAFAAPLLRLLLAEGAGFHFRGLTSTGKTTALLVAGSVWGGGGERGFLDTWRSTANGLEATAALHNDALLCLDEIGEAPGRDIGDIVYFLINGSGKNRMLKNIRARPSSSHRLICLSTGERTLRDILRSNKQHSKGGQELRLADLEADAGAGMGMFENLHGISSPGEFARKLRYRALTYYGTAIVTFLEQLIRRKDEIVEFTRGFRNDFTAAWERPGVSPEVARLAATMGIVSAAGESATHFGITGWKQGEARRATEACLGSWIRSRGGTGVIDIERGIQKLTLFLQQHESRFQEWGSTISVHERAGYRDEDMFYVYRGIFEQDICSPYDYRAIHHELVTRGLAVPGDGSHITRKKNGERFVWIRRQILADENIGNEKSGGESGESGEASRN